MGTRDRASTAGRGRSSTAAAPRPEPGAERRPGGAARRELDPDTLAALEEQRRFLLDSLRDLEREHDAGDIDDEDYEALKDDYTARAAAVIRAIDERKVRFAEHRRRRSPLALALTALGVVLFAVVIGVVVMQSSGQRGASDTATGDVRTTTRQQLLEAQSLWTTDPEAALELYDEVLEADPSNVEAMTYRAWLLRNVGGAASGADREALWARALEYLDEAVATDPTYADAHVFRASLRLDLGDAAGAAEDLDAVGEGDVPEFMQPMIDQLRADIEAAAGDLTPDPTAEGGTEPG